MSNQPNTQSNTTQSSQNSDQQAGQRSGKSPLFSNKLVGNRLYLQVADSLAQLIMTNNLSPGDRLPPERELAQVYEVSRQTIREALIALEVLNLVSIKPGSGVYVQNNGNSTPTLTLSTQPGYLEIIEGLSHFCGEATFLATQRASNEELLTLHAYVKKVAERISNKQFAEIPELIMKAHHLIAQACRNTIIASTCNWLWQLHESAASNNTSLDSEPLPQPAADASVYSSEQSSEQSQEHSQVQSLVKTPNINSVHAISDETYCQQFVNCYQEIYELMSRRDADAARKKMQAHLRYLAESLAIT